MCDLLQPPRDALQWLAALREATAKLMSLSAPNQSLTDLVDKYNGAVQVCAQ